LLVAVALTDDDSFESDRVRDVTVGVPLHHDLDAAHSVLNIIVA
jgi:hypothetical protein